MKLDKFRPEKLFTQVFGNLLYFFKIPVPEEKRHPVDVGIPVMEVRTNNTAGEGAHLVLGIDQVQAPSPVFIVVLDKCFYLQSIINKVHES